MESKSLKALFAKNPRIDETADQLRYAQTRIHWKGLVGSSRALSAGAIAEQTPGNQLFILGDKEEAAYFLNDFESLYSEDPRILFYPASYRVPYQLEETDNANVVARAEVLERINNGASVWVVTYPQALFEKVPTQKKLAANTIRVEVGKIYSIDFTIKFLLNLTSYIACSNT